MLDKDLVAYCDDLLEEFVGREWLVKLIDNYLNMPGSQPFLLTDGKNGIGKTALSSYLGRKTKMLHAMHLCIGGRGGTIEPLSFIRSIAEQLSQSCPGFTQALLDTQKLFSDQNIVINQFVELVQDGGRVVGIRNLKIFGLPPETAFDRLIRQPLKKLDDEGKLGHVNILIDDIDEARRSSVKPNIPELLTESLDLPQKVHFIITSSPGSDLKKDFPKKNCIPIEPNSTENKKDVSAFIKTSLEKNKLLQEAISRASLEENIFINELGEMGEWNFLYIKLALRDIIEGNLLPNAHAYPKGLNEYYIRLLDRCLKKREWTGWGTKLIGIVLALQEPASFEQLADICSIMKWSREITYNRLGQIRPLLDPLLYENGEYWRFHWSIASFLYERHQDWPQFWCDEPAGHSRIADYYIRTFKELNAHPDDLAWNKHKGYGMRSLAYHLSKANKRNELRHLLLDYRWIEMKLHATDVNSLLLDYDYIADDEDITSIKGAIRLSAHVLGRDKTQLQSQMYGRLAAFESPPLKALLNQIEKSPRPWLRTLNAAFVLPGEPLFRTIEGKGKISALAVAPDGKSAIAGSCHKDSVDWVFDVWDLEKGILNKSLMSHRDKINAVEFIPKGTRAISASEDGSLMIWDIKDLHLIKKLEGHKDKVRGVAVDPDGKYAVSGSFDRTLIIWDLEKGEKIRTLEGHIGRINAVALTPDGKSIISGSNDRTMKIWDLKSGELKCTLGGRGGRIYSLAASPDGKHVVSASSDKVLRIWDLEAKDAIPVYLGTHDDKITAVAVTSNGKYAISASRDKTLKMYDLGSRALLKTLSGHGGRINSVVVTTKDKYAISVSNDNTFRIWDLEYRSEPRCIKVHDGRINSLAASLDGQFIISASDDNTLKIWNKEKMSLIRTLEGHTGPVNSIAIHPNGKHIVSASDDGTLRRWDLNSGELISTMKAHNQKIRALALTNQGMHVISGSYDESIKLWELDSGKLLREINGHKGGIRALSVTPDGRYMISGSYDNSVIMWDLGNGKIVKIMGKHKDQINSIDITSDGHLAISASGDETLKVWDLKEKVELKTLEGNSGFMSVVDLSPRDRYVASGSYGGTIYLWDLSADNPLATFTGDIHARSCLVAPDGVTIVIGGLEGELQFLRVENMN